VTGAPAQPVLVGLDVGGDGDAWRAAGFAVDASDIGDNADTDEHVDIGCVRLRLGAPARGISAWTLTGVQGVHGGDEIDEIDGLATRGGIAAEATPAVHPNGATLIDHLVVATPDDARTLAALEMLGFEIRRVRDDARPGVRQTFLRAGEVVIEVVTATAGTRDPSGPARFFGIACTVADLDACAQLLGDALGPIADAVQPGRRIATLRGKAIGLDVPIAFMSA
jgi:hypothetical protein